MATFTYGMNVSLDGFVDHDRFNPDPILFRHWIQVVSATPVSLYGRKTYDLMRYWEQDQPDWDTDLKGFARGWRAQHKFVVSTTLADVGPNATLISRDIDRRIDALKSSHPGEIEVSGTILAQSLTARGLIDTYHLYLHPVVLNQGKPFFAGAVPRLRLTDSRPIGPDVIRLTYVPA